MSSAPARRPTALAPPEDAPAGSDLGALDAVSAAVESGAGLPEIVRALARALDASAALIDSAGTVVAVAARSPADERALLETDAGVEVVELRVAEEPVGRLRLRLKGAAPSPTLLGLLRALVASEVGRQQAPAAASREAAAGLLAAVLTRTLRDADEIVAAGAEVGIPLEAGGTVLVVRAHPHVATDDDWRPRVLAACERAARATAAASIAGPGPGPNTAGGEVVILVPDADERTGQRVAAGVVRELEAALPGFTFAVGRSRGAEGPQDLHRAGSEALLAANVADADGGPAALAFEETGAYRLLLPAMSEHPEELERFFAETLEPLIAYDEQYETDLVQTLETFLECDGNVAQTAQRLYTHRHTVRYRLERVRDLSGLDVGSSDGREKLSLGLKSMRVLGIAAPRGPATEIGAEGGRVPRPGGRAAP